MFMPTLFRDDLFDDFFDDFGRRGTQASMTPVTLMKTDIQEKDTGYEISVDLPGFKKDELKVELNNGYLTISAEKSLNKDEEDNGKLIRQERYSGSMQRSFYVGSSLTEEDIHCAYENGVLKVFLPKKDARKVPEMKTIMIEG